MAEIENTLISDFMLTQCFNQYLSLPIFPVHLHYNEVKVSVSIKSPSGALLHCSKEDVPKLYHLLMEWLGHFCWPFFLKSQLYCKYRLCCCLQKRRQGCSNSIDFIEFLYFEKCTECTLAAPLIRLWICCEAHDIGVQQRWANLCTLRCLCTTIPFLSEMATGSGKHWIHSIQNRILQRLKFYWLPRLSLRVRLSLKSEDNEHNTPFYNGLVWNLFSGDPFLHFVSRYGSRINRHQAFLWQDAHLLLTVPPAEKILNEYWKFWSTYLTPGGEYFVEILSGLPDALHIALQWKNVDAANNVLQQIQGDVFSSLKRLWTKYQKELYSKYIYCFDEDHVQDETNKLSSSHCTNQKRFRKKKVDPKVLLASDFEESAFKTLGDVEMFFQFEQFVFTSRGPWSEENTLLKLWKTITRYHKTLQMERRDILAISIHKAFISDRSRFSVSLPKELLEFLDPDIPHDRPSTAALKQLQKFAEASLQPLIDFFLDVQGGLGSSLSAMEKTQLALSKKACSHQQLQEDALHLSKTLDSCEGPITHKLKAFSEYLASNGTLQGLPNNVQFWLEVNKFKTMYRSEASTLILYHKEEALVDRYLDTSTPPWIKISLSSEITNQIVSAVEDVHRYKNQAFFMEHSMDLFEHAQHKVFTDMVPYWGSFCKQYQSPTESTVSLPQVGDFNPLHLSPAPPKWLQEINKDDRRMINEFGSLTQAQLMEKVRALQNMAYRLGVEEAKEMSRGKCLDVFQSPSLDNAEPKQD